MQVAIVDAGPLIAAVDPRDPNHAAAAAALQAAGYLQMIPALVVAEASFIIGRQLGAEVESRFLQGLREFEVQAPAPDDWGRIAQLVHDYRDFPLGGTDAFVIVLAERHETDVVITFDRRHFSAVKPRHCDSLRLLPT